jgi:hypothetical protein
MNVNRRRVSSGPAIARWSLGVLIIGPLACSGTPEPSGDDGDETTGGGVGLTPRPRFLEPEDGNLRIDADRLDPVVLRVKQITVGSTQLVVDGVSLGPLPPGADDGELGDDEIVLNFRGAMTSGIHALALFNPGIPGGTTSPPIAVDVRAVSELGTDIDVVFDPVPVDAAESLHVVGAADASVLLWTIADTVRMARTDADGQWDVSGIHEWVAQDTTTLTAGRVSAAFDPETEGVRLAWLANGAGGTSGPEVAARWASGIWDQPVEHEGIAFDGRHPAIAATEWAELDTLFIAKDALLVSVHAPSDVESPRPGDWRVFSLGWSDAHMPSEIPAAVVPGGGVDVEGFGPVIDLLHTQRDPSAMVRVGGAWPDVVQVSSRTGFAALADPAALRRTPRRGPLRTMVAVGGALGSRVSLLSTDEGVFAHAAAVWAERADEPALPSELPPMPASGPIGASTLGGRPIFAIPYGSTEPAWLLIHTGTAFRARSLGRSCDALGVSTSGAGDALVDGRLEFDIELACLDQGTLWRGQVTRPAD